jgi:hypothetical protein
MRTQGAQTKAKKKKRWDDFETGHIFENSGECGTHEQNRLGRAHARIIPPGRSAVVQHHSVSAHSVLNRCSTSAQPIPLESSPAGGAPFFFEEWSRQTPLSVCS